jgi:hypothetical protein
MWLADVMAKNIVGTGISEPDRAVPLKQENS